MSDPGVMWAEGLFSPQTTLDSVTPLVSIFLCHPNNGTENASPDDEPPSNGWGYPYTEEDTDGNVTRLPLGTMGGPNQVKLVSKRNSSWGKSNTPGTQLYGNIDWLGPSVGTTEEGDEIYMRLSWHGPQLRYFKDDRFIYDDEDKYSDVYYQGKYVAIAPLPVLGAAARKGSDDTWMLYVICKNGDADRIYQYHMKLSGWAKGSMTDEIRDQLTSPYNLQTNPYGYKIVHNIPHQSIQGTPGHEIDEVAYPADTPWFFNKSCTKAVCMRSVEATYLDEHGEEYTEDHVSKYILQVGSATGGFSFDYGGNIDKYRWHEEHQYIKHVVNAPEDLWCSYPCTYPSVPADDDPDCVGDNIVDHPDAPCRDVSDNNYPCTDEQLGHNYVRFKVQQLVYALGAQVVATDFDGDTQVTAKVTIEVVRAHNMEFNWGVDCDVYYQTPLHTEDPYDYGRCPHGVVDCSVEQCQNDGKPACNNHPDVPPFFLNGASSPWSGGKGQYKLEFDNSTGSKEFTLFADFYGSEYQKNHDGQRRDEWDVYLEYHGYTKRFPHFIDLRHPYIIIYTELYSDEWIKWNKTAKSGRYNGASGEITTTLYQKEAHSIDTDEATYISNDTIVDTTNSGRIVGMDWKGDMTDPKEDIGGPDWPFSDDVDYEHKEGTDKYVYDTVFINTGWQEGLDQRSPDALLIEPRMDDWYANSILGVNKWSSWSSFFYNKHYDDILRAEVQFNYVTGGFARSDENWMVSYLQPALNGVDYTAPSDNWLNYINEGDSLGIFGDGTEATNPIGVY